MTPKPRRRTTDSTLLARIVAEARPRFVASLALAIIAACANYVIDNHTRVSEAARAGAANAEAIRQLQLDVKRLQGDRTP